MSPMEVVAPGVRRIVAPNPSPMTGDGTNTYVVGEGRVAIIDPGPDLSEHVEAALSAARRDRGRIEAILVTHAHPDHLPAAYKLREHSGAPILAHTAVPGIDRPLVDGDHVDVGRARLQVYETPGHAPDHLCFWHHTARVLFSGDLVAGRGTVVLGEGRDALVHYLHSLDRMAALAPMAILPGHGPSVADGAAKLFEYLEHRAERDRQILAALRDGPAGVDSLVGRIYAGTDPHLLPLAARNARAHLYRLEDTGRVRVIAGAWSLSEA